MSSSLKELVITVFLLYEAFYKRPSNKTGGGASEIFLKTCFL